MNAQRGGSLGHIADGIIAIDTPDGLGALRRDRLGWDRLQTVIFGLDRAAVCRLLVDQRHLDGGLRIERLELQ